MDQLEEIKSKIDIVSLISEYFPLKKAGRNFKALCPFHGEKTPSFVVSPERQIFHCFGCQAGGDIFGFLMKVENVEFYEALKILAQRAGVKLVYQEQSESGKEKERLYEVNHLASEFFKYILLSLPAGKKALNYLTERKITKESIELFGIGYAPNSWEVLQRYLLKKGYEPTLLEKAGLVIGREGRSGYYDRFRGRVMFTLRDNRGNVVGFAGRVLDPLAKEAKYVNTPETMLYHKSDVLYGLDITKNAIKKDESAVVVEGEIDLISSYQAGVTNVVAIKGSALTEGHVKLLKRYTNKLAIALDADLAGDAAARRGIEIADREGFDINVVKLKAGKDPDECVKAGGDLWKESVKEVMPIYDYYIESVTVRFDKTTAEGKKKIGEELLPILASISNDLVREHYVQKLAGVLQMSEEVVTNALKKVLLTKQVVSFGKGVPSKISVVFEEKKGRREILEGYLLTLLLQIEKDGEQAVQSVSAENFSNISFGQIFQSICQYWSKRKTFDITRFVKLVPKELIPMVDALYLYDVGKVGESWEDLQEEIQKTIKAINVVKLKQELSKLSFQIRQAEEGKDTEGLHKLNKKFRDITREIDKLNHV